jgi:hypothetical protein
MFLDFPYTSATRMRFLAVHSLIPNSTSIHGKKLPWPSASLTRFRSRPRHPDLDAGRCIADVRQGTLRDAILYSCSANAAHGMRRTNADKRRAVLRLLEDPEWNANGIRWVARKAGVSEGFVHKLYHDGVSVHGEQMAKPDVRLVERGGTVYEQNTARIGSAPREPRPEPALVDTYARTAMTAAAARSTAAIATRSTLILRTPKVPSRRLAGLAAVFSRSKLFLHPFSTSRPPCRYRPRSP